MRFCRLSALILTSVLTTTSAAAQDIAAKVDEYMNAGVKAGQFSSAILIARQGQVLVSKGYGMANYELDVPITSATAFRIASTTKPFTATAILMLQERGKLSVDDPICRYLTPCPASWKPISIHHLLSHTSGVPDVTRFLDFDAIGITPLTPADLVARIAERPLDFSPGEKFAYSNSGYILLGAIIERVSGMTYQNFLKKNIFGPLDMKSSGFDNPSLVIKNRAAGYVRRDDGFRNARYANLTIPFAAGGLYSTVEDLYSWDQAFHAGQLLSAKSVAAMTTPHTATYGYGLMLREEFGKKTIGHGGVIEGFTSLILRYPSEQLTIIVLSNLGDAPSAKIGRDLAAIVFNQPYEVIAERQAISVDPSILEAYVGEYERSPGRNLIVSKRDNRLYLDFINRPTVELHPESQTKFFVKQVNVQLTFVKDDSGRVTHLILHQLGENIPVKKIK